MADRFWLEIDEDSEVSRKKERLKTAKALRAAADSLESTAPIINTSLENCPEEYYSRLGEAYNALTSQIMEDPCDNVDVKLIISAVNRQMNNRIFSQHYFRTIFKPIARVEGTYYEKQDWLRKVNHAWMGVRDEARDMLWAGFSKYLEIEKEMKALAKEFEDDAISKPMEKKKERSGLEGSHKAGKAQAEEPEGDAVDKPTKKRERSELEGSHKAKETLANESEDNMATEPAKKKIRVGTEKPDGTEDIQL